MRKVRHIFEALLLVLLMAFFKVLPLDAASATGGWIGRTVGPRLGASRKALRNLQEAMPELSDEQRGKIITGMWDNLGRVVAEYPHLETIGKNRVKVIGKEVADMVLKNGKCVLISGHIGNWEIAAATVLMQYGQEIDLTYRALNNPWADRLLLKARTLNGKIRCYAKSREGGMEIIKAIREGHIVAILIDQKYNEGVAAPFFGRPAMTNPVFAQLAKKFDCPVVPAHIERLQGANFTITLYEPLAVAGRETEDIIAQAHAHLENWIRKHPEQWLWLHRRWDSQKLEDMKEAA